LLCGEDVRLTTASSPLEHGRYRPSRDEVIQQLHFDERERVPQFPRDQAICLRWRPVAARVVMRDHDREGARVDGLFDDVHREVHGEALTECVRAGLLSRESKLHQGADSTASYRLLHVASISHPAART